MMLRFRKWWREFRKERSWVYDCPDCGTHVQDIVARTDEEWHTWCITRGGCHARTRR